MNAGIFAKQLEKYVSCLKRPEHQALLADVESGVKRFERLAERVGTSPLVVAVIGTSEAVVTQFVRSLSARPYAKEFHINALSNLVGPSLERELSQADQVVFVLDASDVAQGDLEGAQMELQGRIGAARLDLLDSVTIVLLQTDKFATEPDGVSVASSIPRIYMVHAHATDFGQFEQEVLKDWYYRMDQIQLESAQRRMAALCKGLEEALTQSQDRLETRMLELRSEAQEIRFENERIRDTLDGLDSLQNQVSAKVAESKRRLVIQEQAIPVDIISPAEVSNVEAYHFRSESAARKQAVRVFEEWYKENGEQKMTALLTQYEKLLESAKLDFSSRMTEELGTNELLEVGRMEIELPAFSVKRVKLPTPRSFHEWVETGHDPLSDFNYNIFQALTTAEGELRPLLMSYNERLHAQYMERVTGDLPKRMKEAMLAGVNQQVTKLQAHVESGQANLARIQVELEQMRLALEGKAKLLSEFALIADLTTQRKSIVVENSDDLQGWLHRSASGTTLVLRPGTYRIDQPLRLQKSVVLIGESPHNTFLNIVANGLLAVEGNHEFWCKSCEIRNHTDRDALIIDCDEVFLVDCSVRGMNPKARGIRLSSAEGQLVENRFEQLDVAIMLSRTKSLHFERNRFVDNTTAIQCLEGARVTIEDDLFQSQRQQSLLVEEDARVTVTDCVFSGTPWAVRLKGSGEASIRKTEFKHNEVGIDLSKQARAELTACQFKGHRQGAMLMGGTSTLRMQDSRLRDNQCALVVTAGANVNLNLRQNEFVAHTTHSVMVHGNVRGRIEQNRFDQPLAFAIRLQRLSRLRLRRNIFVVTAAQVPLTFADRTNRVRQVVSQVLALF